MNRAISVVLLCVFAVATLSAQTAAEVRGVVTDPSDASIPGATVDITGAQGFQKSASTDEKGQYSIPALLPGKYTIRVSSAGFTPKEIRNVTLRAGQVYTLNTSLIIASEKQTVTVEELSSVSVDPTSTAGAIVLKGEDLNVLSDNPDDLASDLQALAGPSAGPNGGEIFIDGFSGGKLPPKSSIREVRVNQNPFSAEYDRLGFGRIEVFTKPGTDRIRGSAFASFGDQYFNSRNPFSPDRAPYRATQFGFNLGGPLSKKSSYFVDVERRSIDENAVINAPILSDQLLPTPFSESIVTPNRRTSVSPRIDYQLTPKITLVARYHGSFSSNENTGIGQQNLSSRAINTDSTDHSFQITETAVLSAKIINETRFQYIHSNTFQNAISDLPSLTVLDSFSSGGAQIGHSNDISNRYEVTNLTSISHGTHFFKFGGRLRVSALSDRSPTNFGGSYTFAGGPAVALDGANQIILDPTGAPVVGNITSLERYRRTLLFQNMGLTPTQIRALGGGASQFTLSAGNPLTTLDQVDAGLFIEDSWRIRPRLTFNYGLRFETQSNISDHADFAPRVSIAYALDGRNGKPSKTVLRTGFGIFYDRFADNLTLQALRYNGQTQQQYVVANPDFYPNIPAPPALSSNLTQQTIREVSEGLHAPYIAQAVIGIDRQLPYSSTVSVNFVNSRGVHMLRTRNINAPLPGTTIRPYPDQGNIDLYESSGVLNQRQLMTNFNTRFNRRVMLFGFYALGFANSNTDGVGSFPSNTYDLSTEYGRAAYDVRHRFLIGGSLRGPKGVTLNPFIMASSGGAFNITTGRDANGDTIFTDRPSLATDLTRPGVVQTKFGNFNTTPGPNDILIPRNYGDAPGNFTVNLRMSRTWGFGDRGGKAAASGDNFPSGPPPGAMGGPGGGGPRGGGGGGMHGGGGGRGGGGGGFHGGPPGVDLTEKRFNLTLSASARNLLNHVNYGIPVGSLASPIFGQSNSTAGGFGGPGGGGPGGGGGAAGNRRIELQLRLSF